MDDLTLSGTLSGERSAVNACQIEACRPVGASRPTKATGARGVEVNDSGNDDSISIFHHFRLLI